MLHNLLVSIMVTQGLCVGLKKALYCLKQAPKAWHKTLNDKYNNWDMKCAKVMICLFEDI